jgi:O-antigen/teichoic acid export membrane protein
MSRGTGRDIIVTVIGTILPPAAGFVTAPILARGLGVDGRGIVGAATAPLLLMLGIATLGVPDAITYYVARRSGRVRAILVRGSLLLLAAGIVASVAVILLSGPLAGGEPGLAPLIVLASLAVAPGLLTNAVRASASGLGAWHLVTAERLTQALVRLVPLGVLFLVGALDVVTATAVLAVSQFIGVLVYLPLLRGQPHPAPARGTVGVPALLHYGARFWAGGLTGMLLSRLDQALMTPLSSAHELGLYAVAVSIAELPLVFNSAVRDVIFVAESRQGDEERLAQATRLSTAVTVVASAGVGLLAVLSLPALFGQAFAPSIPVTLLLLLGACLLTPGSVAGMGLSARGRPGLRSVSFCIGLAVNVAGIFVLIPPFGAVGAAVATILGNSAAATGNLVLLRTAFGVDPRGFFGLRRGDVRVVLDTVRRRRAPVEREPTGA